MIPLLLATTLSCQDGAWILDGIAETTLGKAEQGEIVIAVREAMPDNCTHEDYEPGSR